MKILIVDDDSNIRNVLTVGLHLAFEEATVVAARDGGEGLQAFQDQSPDLVLLDVTMPGMNGFDVLRAIRQMSDVPVLMVTGRGEDIDQVRGLEIGADDYITKPFSFVALLARIKSVLRRAELPPPLESHAAFAAGCLTINGQCQQVTLAGKSVKLTPLEYKILGELARSHGRLVSHQALLDRVWGMDYGATMDHLKVFICRLRAKLERPSGMRFIETERGLGYRLVRPTELASNAPLENRSLAGLSRIASYQNDSGAPVSAA